MTEVRMAKAAKKKRVGARSGKASVARIADGYETVLASVVEVLESARRAVARSVNAIMTTTYWEIGRRIVEHEQQGRARASYGAALLERLSKDLSKRFGRGFSLTNLEK